MFSHLTSSQFQSLQSTNGALKTINSSRLTVDVEGYLHFSNVTRKDNSDKSMYACSAASYFRNEYKLGNKIWLQVTIIKSLGWSSFRIE